jgi:hypothetical protein
MLRKLHFFLSYDVMLEYTCPKKECHNVLKNTNILKKLFKRFLVFIEFVVYTKHCDSI